MTFVELPVLMLPSSMAIAPLRPALRFVPPDASTLLMLVLSAPKFCVRPNEKSTLSSQLTTPPWSLVELSLSTNDFAAAILRLDGSLMVMLPELSMANTTSVGSVFVRVPPNPCTVNVIWVVSGVPAPWTNMLVGDAVLVTSTWLSAVAAAGRTTPMAAKTSTPITAVAKSCCDALMAPARGGCIYKKIPKRDTIMRFFYNRRFSHFFTIKRQLTKYEACCNSFKI